MVLDLQHTNYTFKDRVASLASQLACLFCELENVSLVCYKYFYSILFLNIKLNSIHNWKNK